VKGHDLIDCGARVVKECRALGGTKDCSTLALHDVGGGVKRCSRRF
jgi:hypothetical protein